MNATAPIDAQSTASLFAGLASLASAEDLTVGKDGFNPHFNYGYMTEAALFTAARAALADAGLSGTITFSEGSIEHITTAHRDDNGNTYERPAIMAFVKASLWIRSADSQHAVECSAYGQGIDPADKAMAKAQTMASKYVVQKALMIAVESDDVDADRSQGTATRSSGGGGKFATEKQLGFLASLVKKLHLAESNDSVDVEFTAWRLARMQGETADTFAKISVGKASDLIEKLKSVENNPAARDVILERLVAWETENGIGAADPAPADDDDTPF